MAYPRSLLHTLCGFLMLLVFTEALKFDLQAYPYRNHKSERCIRNFVSKDTLVVVTATIDGLRGDGMIVNMHVSAIG
jgi:p24 family protein delta-1